MDIARQTIQLRPIDVPTSTATLFRRVSLQFDMRSVTNTYVGIIVERRPPAWRRLPRGYVALYRRLKSWAGCEHKAEAQDLYEQEGFSPRRMYADAALVMVAFFAIILLAAAANLLNAWLWIPLVPVVAVAAPIASFLFRLPGSI